jgi:hypothetical protein
MGCCTSKQPYVKSPSEKPTSNTPTSIEVAIQHDPQTPISSHDQELLTTEWGMIIL